MQTNVVLDDSELIERAVGRQAVSGEGSAIEAGLRRWCGVKRARNGFANSRAGGGERRPMDAMRRD